jgi:lipopolysaccharide transport system permease protein
MESKERIITAGKSLSLYFSEIWDSRELLWILAKRDIIVKYKQTILGVAWSAIRPLITTLVMAFAFGKIGKLDQDTVIPFTLIVLPGVIVWLFFAQSLVSLSQSLVSNSNLVTKVYFPRIIIPLSTVFLGLVDVLVAVSIFFCLCIYYQFIPDYKIIFAPLILLLAFFSVFGIGLISAVLNVKYRDIGQLVPFVVQFGYFISAVGYTSDTVKKMGNGDWKYKLFCLNPVTGIADAMRWCLLGEHGVFNWNSFIPLIIFILISSVVAISFFRKHENSFVDHI